VSDVTHLSEDFYEKFFDIAARLQDHLTWKQYGELLHYFRDKKLAGATRHIEYVLNQHNKSVNKTGLAILRKYSHSWHQFYRDVVSIIEDFEQFMAIVYDWNELMCENGGPKRAGQLARKSEKELSAPPLPYALAPSAPHVLARPVALHVQ
jgi:hypothetical protein